MDDIKVLRSIQSQGAYDLISTLRTVEINATDICNRDCSFCPQSTDDFNVTKRQMSLDTVEKIGRDLSEINYQGRITFTGFGEPLLYKNLNSAVRLISTSVPAARWIEIVTNGDYLTRDRAVVLDQAGCTNVTVSMYDQDISREIRHLFHGTSIDLTFKHYYLDFQKVNRNDILSEKINTVKNSPCHLPFYKMIIDIDGSLRLCANDWSRSTNLGNVNDHKLLDLWLGSSFANFRKFLINGERKSCKPCKFCNIDGTMSGHQSFEIWKDHL